MTSVARVASLTKRRSRENHLLNIAAVQPDEFLVVIYHSLTNRIPNPEQLERIVRELCHCCGARLES